MLKDTTPTAFPSHNRGPPESPCKGEDNYLIDDVAIMTSWHSLQSNIKHTWQNPFFVLYPPAQMTLSGRVIGVGILPHSFLQTSRSMIDTSTLRSLSTAVPPVLVYPHPATMHFFLFFIFIVGSRISFTFLLSLAGRVSWRNAETESKYNQCIFLTR